MDFNNQIQLTLMASASYKKHNEKNVLAECAVPGKKKPQTDSLLYRFMKNSKEPQMKIMLNGKHIISLGENVMKIKCFSAVLTLSEMVKWMIILYIWLTWTGIPII